MFSYLIKLFNIGDDFDKLIKNLLGQILLAI